MEGKEYVVSWCVSRCNTLCSIGKGTGYKAKELASLVEGSSLLIGGKEIEVQYYTNLVHNGANAQTLYTVW